MTLAAEIVKNSVSYPYNNGTGGDIVLRAYVNKGSETTYLPNINRAGPLTQMVLSYPGGGAIWSFGVEEVYWELGTGGPALVQAKNIQLTVELFKK